jgi:hypothetical protein
LQISLLVRLGHRLHGAHIPAAVLARHLAVHQRGNVVGQVEHDLAEQHVLERQGRARVFGGGEALERLEEVGVAAAASVVSGHR